MKKIIALTLVLVLALSMATVAFADDKYVDSDLSAKPGDKLIVRLSDLNDNGAPDIAAKYFNAEYFKVSSIKYTSGSALVESVKFNSDDQLVIKFKTNYSLEAPKTTNFEIKEITVRTIKDTKKASDGSVVKKGAEFERTSFAPMTIGYTVNKADPASDGNNVWYKVQNTDDYTFDIDDVTVEYKAYKDGKVLFHLDTDPIEEVYKNYDGNFDFYTFKNAPSLYNGKVLFNIDKDSFIYEVKDGKLLETNFKWSEDDQAYTAKLKTLGSYVVSDAKLKAGAIPGSAAEEETKNPNTGANDVVGVAVALAVVSLVAAGAVSLKK